MLNFNRLLLFYLISILGICYGFLDLSKLFGGSLLHSTNLKNRRVHLLPPFAGSLPPGIQPSYGSRKATPPFVSTDCSTNPLPPNDIIIGIDGSGSVGEDGWKKLLDFVRDKLIPALQGDWLPDEKRNWIKVIRISYADKFRLKQLLPAKVGIASSSNWLHNPSKDDTDDLSDENFPYEPDLDDGFVSGYQDMYDRAFQYEFSNYPKEITLQTQNRSIHHS